MIKGKTRPVYDDFEQEVFELIGSIQDMSGVAYYFYELDTVFMTSEVCLRERAEAYNVSLRDEDPKVLRSIIFSDPDHAIKSIPNLQALWKAYFIAVHSEFEHSWRTIYEAFNTFTSATTSYGKIADTYFNGKTPASYTRLDTLVSVHPLLFDYNFIRNKIVHGKVNTSSAEFQRTHAAIDSGQIPYIKIETSGLLAHFEITDIKFIQKYTGGILNFFGAILPV